MNSIRRTASISRASSAENTGKISSINVITVIP